MRRVSINVAASNLEPLKCSHSCPVVAFYHALPGITPRVCSPPIGLCWTVSDDHQPVSACATTIAHKHPRRRSKEAGEADVKTKKNGRPAYLVWNPQARQRELSSPPTWYTSGREEEEDEVTRRCPCGTAIESRAHIVGECGIYFWRNGMC